MCALHTKEFVMGSMKALAFAGAVAALAIPDGLAPTAHAADLLPPPPQLEPVPAAPAAATGFYLRGELGVGFNEATDRTSTFAAPYTMASLNAWYGGTSLDSSFIAGLGAGYQFNSWFRADVTGEYRASATYKSSNYYSGSAVACAGLPSGVCGDAYSGQASVGLFLVNGYFDLGTWSGFTPYVGAGVGLADYSMGKVTDQSMQIVAPGGAAGYGVSGSTSGANFAWALMAGVAYQLGPDLLVDIGYRYVNMGQVNTGAISCSSVCFYESQHFDLWSNDLLFGLRWLMPAYAPPVVVAKY
jgi:opacity protein-like surface antigen